MSASETLRKDSNNTHRENTPSVHQALALLLLRALGLRRLDEAGHPGDTVTQRVAGEPCLEPRWKRLLHLNAR